MSELAAPSASNERLLVGIAAVAQLAVVLDVSLLMPLGPDLVEPLSIPASALGALLGAYAGAAALSGLACTLFLDRFARRRALPLVLLGLGCISGCCGLAPSFAVLLVLRVLAGLLGAPTMALIMALITDEVPVARRGWALGRVLGANALVGVVGIPFALWLAGACGWGAAFGVSAAAALLACALAFVAWRGPPSTTARVPDRERNTAVRGGAQAWTRRLCHLLIFMSFAAIFPLYANLSAFVQFNLGFPRASLPLLYMGAAAVSLVLMGLTGAAVDRLGAARVGSVAVLSLIVGVVIFLAFDPPLIGVELAFVWLLGWASSRNVSFRTLTSYVPDADARARFMAGQAAARQLGSLFGACIGLVLLDEGEGAELVGMRSLALSSIVLLALLPPLLLRIEARRVRAPPA